MNERTPLLSVIVPVYNVEKYVEQCVNSILNQTYRNLEIICVDDGSTDKSGEIIDSLKENDNRIITFHKRNSGIVNTRKTGIMHASGDYVTYVDSDDWIDECMYFEMMNLALINNADIVTSGCFREYENNRAIESESLSKGVYSKESLIYDFLANMIGHEAFFEQNIKVNLWNKIYRKNAILKYQMATCDGINIGDDAAVTYPAMINANSIIVSGKNYYHYRIRQNSTTGKADKQEEKSLELLEKHLTKQFSNSRDYPNKNTQLKATLLYTRLLAMPETVVGYRNDYLYPYLSVRKTDRIIVYGNGRYGKKLISHLQMLGADIVGISDQNKTEGIIPIEELIHKDFDKLILAVLNNTLVLQAVNLLVNAGIPRNKISRIELSGLLEY